MSDSLTVVFPTGAPDLYSQDFIPGRSQTLLWAAGKPLISHLLDTFNSLPKTLPRSFLFIIDENSLGVKDYIREQHPKLQVRFKVLRKHPGPAHALYLARDQISGPILLTPPDRIIETDFSFLANAPSTSTAWIREAAAPGQGNYAVPSDDGRIKKIETRPGGTGSRLAITGMYYFPDSAVLIDAIEKQIIRERHSSDDFSIAETVNWLLSNGMQLRIEQAAAWLNTGTKDALLETNAYLLENRQANFTMPADADGTTVLPPAFVDPSAQLEDSIIGPNVSVGPNARIEGSVLQNCIIGSGTRLTGCSIKDSIIGKNAILQGVSGIISIGDQAEIYSDSPSA